MFKSCNKGPRSVQTPVKVVTHLGAPRREAGCFGSTVALKDLEWRDRVRVADVEATDS